MLDYKFLTHTSELNNKKIKSYYETNFSGVIYVVILTEDDYVLAKSYTAARQYDMDYIHEDFYESIEELFESLDHELIGVLINEEEYEYLTNKEEESYEIEERIRLESIKQQEYNEYLKLKEKFEVNYKLD